MSAASGPLTDGSAPGDLHWPDQGGPLRTGVGHGRMKKQDAERLADAESTYVPVNEGAVAALRVVHERGELARRVFRARWYPCFEQGFEQG
jgi:hypothetical protein